MPAAPPNTVETNSLDSLIGPEVFHDEFFKAIVDLARTAAIDTVLEIGSSSGGGSTLAWVEGIRQNPRRPRLYCMEVSRTRCAALKERWDREGFVECYLGSSVRPDQFPDPGAVEHFYRTVPGPLQQYPLPEVLGWLKQDLDYLAKEQVPTGCIERIKQERSIQHFGAVLIDGSEFTGNAELDEVYGAEYILLDDIRTYKCHEAHQRLLRDPGYELIAENASLRHGYSIFQRRRRTRLDPLPHTTPVHFFTIVLNGQPFIRYHIDVLQQLPFPWHWHIVEGAASLTHDTARNPGRPAALPDLLHANGLSSDGTSTLLDDLAGQFPDNISLYRPPPGRLWDGKIEMVTQPLAAIREESILWQLDSDELWTAAQLTAGRQLFLDSPEKNAAFFWCHFFTGPALVISSRFGYSADPAHEWLRAWRFRPGMKWLSHEPPALAERRKDGTWQDLVQGPVFTHRETEAAGLVFQHFAYATEDQVSFKERYYGYPGATAGWQSLQACQEFPRPLREFFPWVEDRTAVNTAVACGITPLALRDTVGGLWSFPSRRLDIPRSGPPPIVIDGLFFQLNNTGIGRLWQEILRIWSGDPVLASRIVILDRDGTAPRLHHFTYYPVSRHQPGALGHDSLMLQAICDGLGAGVFMSSYYGTPTRTPSVVPVYDMIPELLGLDREDWQWTAKHLDLLRGHHFACISHATAQDLIHLHPDIVREKISVFPLAAPPGYSPATAAAMENFRRCHNLPEDYLLIAGERIGQHINTQGYKNAALTFRAWSLLPLEERQSLTIVCAGGKPYLEEELRLIAPDAAVRLIRFSDEDLVCAYSGAVALLYPSLYEGFGLPVLEAMACGCPVITCQRSSLTEIAGDAALFVNPWDAAATACAVLSLRHDSVARAEMTRRGVIQAARFSYHASAACLADILLRIADAPVPNNTNGVIWETFAAFRQQTSDTARISQVKLEKIQTKLAKQEEKVVSLGKKIEQLKSSSIHKKRSPLRSVWEFFHFRK